MVEKNKKHVVCIILYDKDKKVLLQHRTKDALRLPDYWAFFGGAMENGETQKVAAIREIYEEVNFVSKNIKLTLIQDFELLDGKQVKNVFVEFCDDKSNLELHEGQGWGWYDIDETKKLRMISHDREALYFIKKNILMKKR